MDELTLEKVLVVQEVHLHSHAFIGQRGDLDNERVVIVVHDNVHPRKADDLVQAVAPLVDGAVAGHQHPDFHLIFL